MPWTKYKSITNWNRFASIVEVPYKTAEGIELVIKVISDQNKTCAVGDGLYPAIDETIITSIAIPETVNGYQVVRLSNYAFKGCKITGITLPKTINQIGRSAFDMCTNLTKIELPEGITEIDEYTFKITKNPNTDQISIRNSYNGESFLTFPTNKTVIKERMKFRR